MGPSLLNGGGTLNPRLRNGRAGRARPSRRPRAPQIADFVATSNARPLRDAGERNGNGRGLDSSHLLREKTHSDVLRIAAALLQ